MSRSHFVPLVQFPGNLAYGEKCCSVLNHARYDGLGRLTSATNPESGTVTYSYLNGSTPKQTLQSRTDNRGTATGKTTYAYDADNRLKTVTYTDGTPTQT